MKTAINAKTTCLWSFLSKFLLSVRDIETTPEPQNCGQELMKMALKCKNNEFLVMPLKNVLSIMGLVNHPGTQKM
jgi:hypothetical protein